MFLDNFKRMLVILDNNIHELKDIIVILDYLKKFDISNMTDEEVKNNFIKWLCK